ncbi:MAG: Fe-S protein assembly co-chaperone HscB [Pseudomonadales bacterium]|nr:Fe-S protein assembly co-chaperone HscB [Pseudomonadales bacterium]
MNFNQNFFEIFQLTPSFDLNLDVLGERYQTLQRRVHPDRFVGQGAQAERLATQWATQINEAYRTLSDGLSRAIYLLSMDSIELEENPTLSGAFLMEQIDLREDLEAAELSGEASVVLKFMNRLKNHMAEAEICFQKAHTDGAFEEALQVVYRMQFLKKLMLSARAAEDKLLGY